MGRLLTYFALLLYSLATNQAREYLALPDHQLPPSEVADPLPTPVNPWKPQQGNTYHLRPNASVRAVVAPSKPHAAVRHSTPSAEITKQTQPLNTSPINNSEPAEKTAATIMVPAAQLRRLVLLAPAADLDKIPDDDTVLDPVVDVGVQLTEQEREVLSSYLGADLSTAFLTKLPQTLFHSLTNLGRSVRGLTLIRCDRSTGEVIMRVIP